MEDHLAPLTMTMMRPVGIVQEVMVEGGGTGAVFTVSLQVAIRLDVLHGVLDHETYTFHMWR